MTMVERQRSGKQPASFAVASAGEAPLEIAPQHNATPLSPEQLLQQALALQAGGQLQQAAGLFQQLLTDNPRDVVAAFSLGVIAQNLGDAGAALVYFDRAVELNPQFSQSWHNRAVVLQALGRYQDAQVSYHTARLLEVAKVS